MPEDTKPNGGANPEVAVIPVTGVTPPPGPPLTIEERITLLEKNVGVITGILKSHGLGANGALGSGIAGRLSGVSGEVTKLADDIESRKDKLRLRVNILSQRIDGAEDRLTDVERDLTRRGINKE